jgi:hypothetical protein
MKTRRMRQAEHVACMTEMRNAYKIYSKNLKGTMGNVSIDTRTVLKWIIKK